jgi:hypothetical protein
VPEVLGAGHFITLRDLAPIRRLERLEAIGPFYYELAAQTATPLSLVKTWLTRLHSAAADHGDYRDLCSLAQKALLQLKHVEITHDRMQLYDDEQARRLPTHRVPLDLLVELRLLLQEFPLCETSRIDIGLAPLRVSVLADRMQVAFMFKTVFAYLLRSIPPDDQAAIRVSVDVGLCAHVRIEGVAPPDPLSADDAYAFARAQFQLTLSESLLQTFAANNSAIYHDREYVDGHVVFRIDFELAQEARP